MISMPEYWTAVAQEIDAEDAKAKLFLEHGPSLGTAREAILRRLFLRHTPAPFAVRTGFIHKLQPARHVSLQCDILVYNPATSQPDYSVDELVVVPRDAAVAVVEVKSTLTEKKLSHILDVWDSVHWHGVPGFGFAYNAGTFTNFVRYIATALQQRPAGLPYCIAVHKQNYLFVHSGYRLEERGRVPWSWWHRPATYQLAVDLGSNPSLIGHATGFLFDSFNRHIRAGWTEAYLLNWFNNLPVPDGAKVRFDFDGNVTCGPIPKHNA